MERPALHIIKGNRQDYQWSTSVLTDDGFQGLYIIYEVRRRMSMRLYWQSGEWCRACDKVYFWPNRGLYGLYPPPLVCPACWGNRPIPFAVIEFVWHQKPEFGHIDEIGQWYVHLGADHPTEPPQAWKYATDYRLSDLSIDEQSDCYERFTRSIYRHPLWKAQAPRPRRIK